MHRHHICWGAYNIQPPHCFLMLLPKTKQMSFDAEFFVYALKITFPLISPLVTVVRLGVQQHACHMHIYKVGPYFLPFCHQNQDF